MNMLNCPICDHNAERKYARHIGYQQPKEFDIYHCDYCNTAFSHPQHIDHELYDLIYNQIADVPGYDRYLKYAENVLTQNDPLEFLGKSEDVYWAIQQYIMNKKQCGLKILEVGSGFGYLTYALNKLGFNIQGLDISVVAVEEAVKRYGDHYICSDVFEYSQQGHEYDIVILTEVIEHIPNIKAFLEAIKNLLSPIGEVVLTTPNKSMYPKDVLWETEPPPVHLWWLSEESIDILASQLDCQASFIDFTEYNMTNRSELPMNFSGFKPSRLARLDARGFVLKHGDYIQQENYIRELIKSFLSKMGLLKFFQILKKQVRTPLNRRRGVLCAILSKKEVSNSTC